MADQLFGNENRHKEVRKAAVDYIKKNRNEYEPFMDENTTIDKYCDLMSLNAVWGGQMELNALAKAYKFNLIVHKIDSPSMGHVFHSPIGSVATIHLSFHMGSHYNSIRRSDDPCHIGDSPIEKYVIGHNLDKILKDFKGKVEPKSKIKKLVKYDDQDEDSTSTNSKEEAKDQKEESKEKPKEDDEPDSISEHLIEYALNFTEASPDNSENIKLMKFVFELVFDQDQIGCLNE